MWDKVSSHWAKGGGEIKLSYNCSVWRPWLWSISFTRDFRAENVLTQRSTDTFDHSWRMARFSPFTQRAFCFQRRRLKIPLRIILLAPRFNVHIPSKDSSSEIIWPNIVFFRNRGLRHKGTRYRGPTESPFLSNRSPLPEIKAPRSRLLQCVRQWI